MARDLKPLKVETYSDHRRKVLVDLMLNRNTKTFFATVQLEEIEADSIAKLRELVRAKVDAWRPLNWRRVIELKVDSDNQKYTINRSRTNRSYTRCEIDFTFERIEIAESMNGSLLARPFSEDLDDDDRPQQEKNPLAFAESCGGWRLERHVPYGDEAWATLQALKEAMDTAHAKIVSLFDTTTGGRLLAAYQPHGLLPSGVDDKGHGKRRAS